MRPRSLISGLALVSILILAFTSTALAAPQQRIVLIRDNCDGPTFNAAIGPGTCIRNGGLTFDAFFARLSSGGAASWRFSPSRASVQAGGTVLAVNRGGETHSFTEVAAYGGGCVPPINEAMGLSPVPECEDPASFATFIPAGGSLTTGALSAGTHRFQCLIHPWQRSTITGR
jgi:plastocyanin